MSSELQESEAKTPTLRSYVDFLINPSSFDDKSDEEVRAFLKGTIEYHKGAAHLFDCSLDFVNVGTEILSSTCNIRYFRILSEVNLDALKFTDPRFTPCLYMAIVTGNIPAATIILDLCPEQLNAHSEDKTTLFWACVEAPNAAEVFDFLVARGHDGFDSFQIICRFKRDSSLNPIDRALVLNKLDLAMKMARFCPQAADLCCYYPRNIFQILATQNRISDFAELVNLGCKNYHIPYGRNSPLETVVNARNTTFIIYLLGLIGEDAHFCTPEGNIFHHLVDVGDLKYVELFFSRNTRFLENDFPGKGTPIQYAFTEKKFDIAEFFLEQKLISSHPRLTGSYTSEFIEHPRFAKYFKQMYKPIKPKRSKRPYALDEEESSQRQRTD